MARIALGLSYCGSAYHGWQLQAQLPTVQSLLERAVARFLDLPQVSTVCAGRTDAGVHALNQVVHLDTDAAREMFSWVRGTNSFLPADIRVNWAQAVQEDFHARNSATRRRYRYLLYEGPVAPAIAAGRAGWVFTPRETPLKPGPMREAAAQLIGEHDFSSFRAAQCQALSPVKWLYRLDIERQGPWWTFTFEASAFLHHMVRNIMGTLLAIGTGKRPPDWAARLLALRDRTQGDPTFMPDGLYLDGVAYPERFGLNERSWQQQPLLL
jgi:tRNA pseudouridine38-40 synthase